MRSKKNPGVKFEYTLSANSTLVPKYIWKLGDWTACSATCGGGTQRRISICYQEDKGYINKLKGTLIYYSFD